VSPSAPLPDPTPALSLRATSEAQLGEILDAWLGGVLSTDESDTRNVAHLQELDQNR
jgi:ribose 5-phosphate isomerase B